MSDLSSSRPPANADSDAPSGFGAGWAEHRTLEIEEDALTGVVLNETYHIARVIGEGGMGRVYEAWHTRISKKRYAIKVLHAEFARTEGILKRFQREAETAACLSHPNAVGVYDVGVTADQRPFLVSEYLEGTDLAHRVKELAPLSPGLVKHIGLQIAGALVEAHSRGVVHRDLKPQNIFLLAGPGGEMAERPIAKVLDFGLSRFLDDADSELTRSGMVMGTPSYMSPEQARGERADHRVDVYGLGAILYACVVGKPPFKCSSPQATVLAVMNEEAPRPSKENPNVAPELELVIQTAMAREPSRRYQTMNEFVEALQALPGDDGPARPRPRLDSIVRRFDGVPLRAQLVGTWVIGAVFGLAAAGAALCGAVNLRYGAWPLPPATSGLLGMVVVAAFAAPLLSWIRAVRYRLWDNTPLVAQTLVAAQRVMATSGLAYGATAGTLLLCNVTRSLFPQLDALGETALTSFSGISIVAFAALAATALVAGLHQQLMAPDGWVDTAETAAQARTRQRIAGVLVAVSGVLLVLSAALAVFRWPLPAAETAGLSRAEAVVGAAESPAAAAPTSASAAAVGTTVTAVATLEPAALSVEDAPSAAPVGAAMSEPDGGATPAIDGLAEANNDALSAAISQGTEALERLVAQYPNDAQALRALAMDHASRASGLEKAIEVFRRLFVVSPQAIHDTDLQQIVMAVARAKGSAMHKAFDLMGYGMGHVGPDLLFKLALSDRDRRAQARAYLGRHKVRERFSPALDVAYELQFASSCASRLPLLPRAAQFGDERALVVLAAMAAAPKTGCGKRKLQPCRAKCPDEAAAFEQTVKAIAGRLQRVAPPAPSHAP